MLVPGSPPTPTGRVSSTLYDELARVTPSPVVELNRAVAVSMARGPAEALSLVDALADDPALAEYYPLPAVRGDLLDRLGRRAEARVEFERAGGLTRNSREREVLLARAAACAGEVTQRPWLSGSSCWPCWHTPTTSRWAWAG